MRFDHFSFGTIRIDGSICEHDVVIDRGEVRKRKKGPSKQFSDAFGHTPLSIKEKIPWKCRQLVIGTGAYGTLSVMKEVESEAKRRRVELVVLPTSQAINVLNGRCGVSTTHNLPQKWAPFDIACDGNLSTVTCWSEPAALI